MLWIGHTRSLSRCTSGLLVGGSFAPSRLAVSRQNLRNASTATGPKPRAKKTTTVTSDQPVAIPKKKLSTKSATGTVAAPAKSSRKKKVDIVAAAAGESAASEAASTVVKKTTGATSTKTTSKKKAETKAAESKKSTAATKAAPAQARFARTTKSSDGEVKPVGAAFVSEPSPVSPVQPPPSPITKPVAAVSTPPKPTPAPRTAPVDVLPPRKASVGPIRPRPSTAPETPKKVDPKSSEFKQASRKWVSTMVALPILFVTSYYLFDRLALGNEQKDVSSLLPPPLPTLDEKPPASDARKSA